MMADANIIDISDESFDYEVVSYSSHTPVVLDFGHLGVSLAGYYHRC
jgi:thioredoxin-like negative regulator of GroEL